MTRRVCILGELAAMAEQRKTASPDDSYTARLLQGDEDSLLKKLAEEAGEAALAAKGGNREKLAPKLPIWRITPLSSWRVIMSHWNKSRRHCARAGAVRDLAKNPRAKGNKKMGAFGVWTLVSCFVDSGAFVRHKKVARVGRRFGCRYQGI